MRVEEAVESFGGDFTTNNKPEVIAHHYLQCATEFGVIPVRSGRDEADRMIMMMMIFLGRRDEDRLRRSGSQDDKDQFLADPTLSMCGDDQLQANFEELHSQGNFSTPLNWETGVENYITLKNIAEIYSRGIDDIQCLKPIPKSGRQAFITESL
ncbi:hypothetical protein E1301_Tti019920 [Triplophysa tibetana]|uniref:Uncharacterized protein n=1 Tax=Triplophysa tibetana TaxID=1572043 RepID=A0A5A9P2F5_9TELE|nr:hypothetical protein E1301_Tti019920 [Triplophysa tibetana]